MSVFPPSIISPKPNLTLLYLGDMLVASKIPTHKVVHNSFVRSELKQSNLNLESSLFYISYSLWKCQTKAAQSLQPCALIPYYTQTDFVFLSQELILAQYLNLSIHSSYSFKYKIFSFDNTAAVIFKYQTHHKVRSVQKYVVKHLSSQKKWFLRQVQYVL